MVKYIKQHSYILGILILALILRLLFINKPDGLWNDEYISWMISATPFSNGFIHEMKSQCHMPFYYLYLKFFMTLFGQSDIILRLTSVFAGIISVITMYFAGKEKDKRTGLLCAGFSAISSFLIYYSQEVRIYSILFLFSALMLLYTLKTIKNPDKKNLILCIFSNLMIMFTHTIGFVFVLFNLIFLSINLFKQYKKTIIITWSCLCIGGLAMMPIVLKIFTTQSFSQWWGRFSISRIGYLFTDYFSPVLTNLTNCPEFFRHDILFIICAIIPSLIAIVLIIKSLIKNKTNIGLFSIALLTIVVLAAAAILGKLVFITKYSIEIYPILIYLACSGLSDIENKKLRNIIIILYSTISLGYLIFHPTSAPKIRRAEGHKIMTDILTRMDLQKGDVILLEYYPKQRFEKYFNFSDYKTVSINKGNFSKYITPETSYNQAYKNGKKIYKNYFLGQRNTYFESKLQATIINKLKPNQSVVMVTLDSVSFHPPEEVKSIAADKQTYSKEPLLFLVFSYIKETTFNELAKSLQVTKLEKKGNWTIIKFTKLKN